MFTNIFFIYKNINPQLMTESVVDSEKDTGLLLILFLLSLHSIYIVCSQE